MPNSPYSTSLARIKKMKNVTQQDVQVGTLFLDIGLELVAAGKEIKDSKGKLIGEIDLIFSDKEEDVLFLVEVSAKAKKASSKADHFLTKWANETNLKQLKRQTQRTEKRVYRINFDLANTTGEVNASLSHAIEVKENKILFQDDLNYFQETFKAVGKWVRSDLYNYIGLTPKRIASRIPAIVYYIGEHRAFVYADHVSDILKYSYVYRRRKKDLGYQRMVQQTRIGSIAKTIKRNKTITFPNSIILNSKEIVSKEIYRKEDCPLSVEIDIPKSFANFRVVDGQHRLLGFAKMGDFKRDDYMLPIVLLENLDQSKEVQTFIEINHKQKKLDPNLILTIKKDFNWLVTEEEYFEKISVLIAEKLNENSALKNRIYFGYADEKRSNKITVTTLHSVIKKNHLTGLKNSLYQKAENDIETPYAKLRVVFSVIAEIFKAESAFFFSNKGLRVLFRLLQLHERNIQAGHIDRTIKDLIGHIHYLFKKHSLLGVIDENYGEGGAKTATEKAIDMLKENFREYVNFESDLRKV